MTRLRYAQNFVGDTIMIDQLNMLMDSLEFERQERFNKQSFDMWNGQFPDIIESDPEFKKERKSDEKRQVTSSSVPNSKPESSFKRPLNPTVFHKEYNQTAQNDPRNKPNQTPDKQGS